jgi:hypothetical protein
MSYRRARSSVLLLIVSVAFVVLGYHVAIHLGKPILDKAKQTTKWPTVEGKIESSEVIQQPNNHDTESHGPMYSANVCYSYAVNDRTYKSNSIWSGANYSSSSSGEQQRIVDRYPQGKVVAVHYDPEHPGEAVLEPGAFFTSYIMYVVGWFFLVIGGLMLLSIPWTILRRLSGAG